jgi:putative ABC transport system substrate-binding protein
MAADLARRRVTAIAATGGPPSSLAARAATTTVPVVSISGDYPVRLGLVASLARPGGNLTGVSFLTVEVTAKRLELLHELVAGAVRVAVLVNPAEAANTEITLHYGTW